MLMGLVIQFENDSIFGILRSSSFHLHCYCANFYFISLNNAALLHLGSYAQ